MISSDNKKVQAAIVKARPLHDVLKICAPVFDHCVQQTGPTATLRQLPFKYTSSIQTVQIHIQPITNEICAIKSMTTGGPHFQ